MTIKTFKHKGIKKLFEDDDRSGVQPAHAEKLLDILDSSHCGIKKESLSLQERVFKCGHCGFECDRDLNAAINLSHCVALVAKVVASGVKMAVSSTVTACGLDSADTSRVKQEVFVSKC